MICAEVGDYSDSPITFQALFLANKLHQIDNQTLILIVKKILKVLFVFNLQVRIFDFDRQIKWNLD